MSGGRAPDPAPASEARPPSPTPGFTLQAETGGAHGAHWWVQKFKANSTEPARRTRKGRRNPGAAKCAGGVRRRIHWATGRRSGAKGGDSSGPSVSQEGRQVKGGAATEPWGRGSSRCPPGPRAPDPLPCTGGRPRWPSASSSRTAPNQDLPHDPVLPPRVTPAPAALAVEGLPRGKTYGSPFQVLITANQPEILNLTFFVAFSPLFSYLLLNEPFRSQQQTPSSWCKSSFYPAWN